MQLPALQKSVRVYASVPVARYINKRFQYIIIVLMSVILGRKKSVIWKPYIFIQTNNYTK